MYRLFLILLLITAMPALAQSGKTKKSSQPDNLIPLPEIPEPPPLPEDEEANLEKEKKEKEAQVTTIKRGEDTIEEYRINGELIMIKVIPRIGPPYYLKKNLGRGSHTHAGEGGIEVSPPMWELLKF